MSRFYAAFANNKRCVWGLGKNQEECLADAETQLNSYESYSEENKEKQKPFVVVRISPKVYSDIRKYGGQIYLSMLEKDSNGIYGYKVQES